MKGKSPEYLGNTGYFKCHKTINKDRIHKLFLLALCLRGQPKVGRASNSQRINTILHWYVNCILHFPRTRDKSSIHIRHRGSPTTWWYHAMSESKFQCRRGISDVEISEKHIMQLSSHFVVTGFKKLGNSNKIFFFLNSLPRLKM